MIAATAIFARLTDRFGGRTPDPSELAAVDPATLRALGLSRRKAATVLDLAQRFSDGRLSEAELRQLPDVIPPGRPSRFATRSRRATASITSPAPSRWQIWPNTGGRTEASPRACCWPPRDRAEPVNGGGRRAARLWPGPCRGRSALGHDHRELSLQMALCCRCPASVRPVPVYLSFVDGANPIAAVRVVDHVAWQCREHNSVVVDQELLDRPPFGR